MPGKSILLLLCTFFVLVLGWSITPAQAHECDRHKNKSHKHCDEPPSPPPGGDGTPCEIDFCIEFAQGDNKITSDDGNYCHGTDKVLAFTGKGPGFGFDTMQSGKGKSMTRDLNIDLTAFGKGELRKKVVLKFDKSGDSSGLDLCTLENSGTGEVGLAISYEVDGATDNSNTLTYGAPADAACGTKVTVTRVTADTWTIAATKACLWDGQKDALIFKGSRNREIIDDDVDASFFATITVIQ